MTEILDRLAETMVLGALLDSLRTEFGGYELLAHWQQGEFHHDVVLSVPHGRDALPGPYLLVATNCNGGIKEVLALADAPDRYGLWHARCPENPEFAGPAPQIVGRSRTIHWFDPCELLDPDTRSELRPEFRERVRGGGFKRREAPS